MAIISEIYPPIVMDSQPSFIRTTEECRIYFSLSTYNSEADIKNVQISLVNQRTNASAFKSDLYPSGIKIADIYYDSTVRNDYNYYTIISSNDLINGIFELNQFYKVQLRFTSISASNPPDSDSGKELATATWLYNNMQFFSEWSKVCLIKGIEKPIINIRGFDTTEVNQDIILTSPLVQIIGELTYANNSVETEYLKSYNIKLYQSNNMENALIESGEIYTNPHNPN